MQSRRTLLQWAWRFSIANVLLYWLVGLNYLHSIAWLGTEYLTTQAKIGLLIFLGVSYVGHLTCLACLPAALIFFTSVVFPRRRMVFIIAIIIETLAVGLLLSDTVVYRLFHYHINSILLSLFLHALQEPFFNFSLQEYIVCVSSGFFLVGFEFCLAYGLWRWQPFKGWGKWFVIMTAFCLYLSYAMLVFSANANIRRVLLESARILPGYTEFLATLLSHEKGQIALEQMFERYLIQPAQAAHPLHYPQMPLKFVPPAHKLNVVIIVIDAWRFDMLNKTVMPNLFDFSKRATVFTQHFSGGNATGPGIFSLFYALPATYWTAMEVQQRGPVLIDEFLTQNYQINILASAGLTQPAFNKTVFSAIKNLALKIPGSDPYARDVMVTQKFKQFIAQIKKTPRPFLSFLFYDASHSYCALENNFLPFQPAIKKCDRLRFTNETNPLPYLNRYKNALYLVDLQIGAVLQELKTQRLLDNTVVIVTGDHGEEFNDNKLSYWGHASNFTRYQVQTPLLIYWPKSQPTTIRYVTTHFDLAPTLMEKLFGCQTPARAYSFGQSLFLPPASTPYRFVASYIGFGIVTAEQIITLSPTGHFQVMEMNGAPLSATQLDIPLLQEAFHKMWKFYAKP